MSVRALTWVFENSPYALGTRLVHLALADVANEDHDWLVWVSQGKIAEKARVSRPTVIAAIKTMVADGYLEPITHLAGVPSTFRFLRPCKESDTPYKAALQGGVKSTEIAPLLLTEVKQKDPDPFVRFYDIYPEKKARGAALKAFTAALKRAPAEEIITGAERYRDDPNREAEYTKHPATWLNADCWTDAPLPPKRNGNGHSPYPDRHSELDTRGFLRRERVPEA